MSTFPTEITSPLVASLVTSIVSFLFYWLTTPIQQRTKKNNTLRLIGTVYGPLRHFLEVRYIGVVANVLFLTLIFLLILSLSLSFFYLLGFIYLVDLDYLIIIIIDIFLVLSGILISLVLSNFLIKVDRTIRELTNENSAYSTVDRGSRTLRRKALYWGTLILAMRPFLGIFIAVFFTTLVLVFLNNGLKVLGAVLIEFYILSLFISLGLVWFLSFISLRSNNKGLQVSIFDTGDEIESKLFNLIKEPSLCLCIVDDKGNKHCGSLEGITYSVLIRDKGGVLVSIPYDHVYRVEECKVKDDNTGSTLQPYL